MLKVLDPWRTTHPHIVADIEAALNTQRSSHELMDTNDDDEFLAIAERLSPNLYKLVVNNRNGHETVSVRTEFQRLELKAHHIDRLIEKMNKLPSDSPFVQLSVIMSVVMRWASADMEVENLG